MWALNVAVYAPLFDEGLRFLKRVKDFPVEQFITQPAIKALTISILPWSSRFDVSRTYGSNQTSASSALCRMSQRFAMQLTKSWSMDFVVYELVDGRSFRTLNVLDEFNLQSLEIDMDFSIPA